MRNFIQIFREELTLIIKDKSILLTCIIAPIFYAFFVGSIYKEKDVANIPIAIVDHPRLRGNIRVFCCRGTTPLGSSTPWL